MRKGDLKVKSNKRFRHKYVNRIENSGDNDYEVTKKWFEEIVEDPTNYNTVSEQVLIELKDEAKKCHDSEVANYNIKNSKTNSDYQWMKTVMSKGTVSDKIAAHTVAIQDNPICNLETLGNLVSMVKVGKKNACTTVMETLSELFLSDILKPDKKLKGFHQKPLSLLNNLSSGNAVTRRKLLSAWYFEDQLKEVYASFILALNTAAHDTVESNKEKAIAIMYKLLAGNPEQEKNLLTYIVNKLGDPSQKVASKAIYCLNQLLFRHSNMQSVVLNEIEKLLFRTNVSSRAQYYALCFLSQFYLSHDASEVARKLIEVYFSFFKACIKKDDVDSRLLSALLTGINRAYPYAKLEIEKISEHIDTMYRLVHVANFNISLHALTLLYQVSDFGNNISDRFYSALYRKLIDPKLLTTTHQAILLSLIYKALLKDKEISRIKVFVKRLLQIALTVTPSFTCGILYLVSQILGKKENLQSLILQKSSFSNIEEDDDEEKYYDVKDVDTMDIKQEEDNENEERNVQIMNAEVVIKIEDEDDVKPDIEQLNISANASSASWHHCNNIKKEKIHIIEYRPLNRNPLYSGGEFCAFTELCYLRDHFHPTVGLYATNILKGELIKYSGDPLKDFTLIRFLDRFVFKNPKKLENKPGTHSLFATRKMYRASGIKSMSVNSNGYLKENQQNIPVDELFMYTYLQKKYADRGLKEEDESDLESVQSEEFEDMLDKMAGVTNYEDEDIDFMNEIGNKLKTDAKSKTQKNLPKEHSENDLSDDMDDIDELSEEGENELDNLDEDDKELIGDLEDDDDDEDIQFDDSDHEIDILPKKQKHKSKKKDSTSLFASADEFASLLEDEGSSKIVPGGSNAFANKDNANVKQLAWEEKRNQWLHGYNRALGKGKDNKFSRSGKQFDKKRPNKSKFGNNKKKIKK